MRKYVLEGASLLSAMLAINGFAGVAAAQTSPDETTEISGNDQTGEPEETRNASTDTHKQAIIVTARRRDEFLQDVPIAVSAVSAAQAENIGIDDTEALMIATPSLDYSRSSSFAAVPFLRGVGTSFAGAGIESPVAIYVDDVYISSPNGNLMSLDNIETVQVLKGPQGTLFGRNATGGVIQIQTRQPSFETEGRISASYSNYDTMEGSLYLSTGLSDDVAVNIAAGGRKQHNGYGESLATGDDTQKGWDWNLRGKLLANLGPDTTALLSVDYAEQRSDYGSNSAVYPGSIGMGGTTYAGDFNTASDGRDFSSIKQGGASLKIDHKMSFADLVSVSAYRKTKMRSVIDQDASVTPFMELDLTSPIETISQELRLVSNDDGPLQWVIGAFYFHSNGQYDPTLITGLIFDPDFADPTAHLYFNDTQTLDSYSGFAEATYEFLPDTNLTIGLRYTDDSFELKNEGSYMGNEDVFPGALVPDTQYTVDDSFGKLTYRAILDHKITSNVLGYVSYSRGFKSGGYNLPEPGDVNTVEAVKPEVLDAYEAGLKTELFNGDLVFNIAAFYYDYKDLAVSISTDRSIIQINAAHADIKGLDFDFVATPYEGLRIAGGLGLLDAEYKSFPDGPVYTPLPVYPFGNSVSPGDLGGNRMQRAPKLTFSVAPSYTARIGEGDLTLAANWYHNSGYFSDPENRLRQPTYDLLNGSISYELDSGLGARLWIKNLTDERYYTFLQADQFKDASVLAAPRTYGITLWKNF
ncbi:TonB-dependent receptor [Altericroceibacterium spongiae]|uniref:TonB-dependent receptor n=1 Tax=Altericroceibacterium spongiae TaxID=2320269 RepID=A0A420EM58_9SPHN|nr:TonB-dependent receptor [Altericroceibacterium spongiae]RKF21758.1 TonB-dependent receptor [Altericroceibacterium spongiae]